MSKLVLIRGLARGNGHWGDFPKVLKQLSPQLEFELLEISGNGTLNQERTPIDSEEVVAQLRNRSHISKSKEKFNLIGISLGGMIALKWAELYPAEIDKAIIINSSLSQFSSLFERFQMRQYLNLLKASLETNHLKRESIILEMVSNHSDQKRKALHSLAEFSKKYPPSPSNLLRQLILAKFIKINIPKVTAELKFICSRKDRLVHYSCSETMAENFLAEIEVHPTAGHDLPLDDPEWLAQQIINF